MDRNGIITTAAGNGPAGFDGGEYSGDGRLAALAGLDDPAGLTLDAAGNILLSDSQCIRQINPSGLGAIVAQPAHSYAVTITGPHGSITSSVVVIRETSTPAITAIERAAAGVTLQLTAAPAAATRILAASSLSSPAPWPPVATHFPGPDGRRQWTDTNAAELRFYRASTP